LWPNFDLKRGKNTSPYGITRKKSFLAKRKNTNFNADFTKSYDRDCDYYLYILTYLMSVYSQIQSFRKWSILAHKLQLFKKIKSITIPFWEIHIFLRTNKSVTSLLMLLPVKTLHFLLKIFFIVFKSPEPHMGTYVSLTQWRTFVIEWRVYCIHLHRAIGFWYIIINL